MFWRLLSGRFFFVFFFLLRSRCQSHDDAVDFTSLTQGTVKFGHVFMSLRLVSLRVGSLQFWMLFARSVQNVSAFSLSTDNKKS